MTMIYNPLTNENVRLEDISTVTGVTLSTKEITEHFEVPEGSRALLELVNTSLFQNWDYMPVTTQDVSHRIALDTMANSGAYTLAKATAGVVGGLFGSAGIGYLMMEAGISTWQLAKNMNAKDNPREFWEGFVNEMHELRTEDSGFNSFLNGVGVSSSFTSAGASSELYKSWGDMLPEKGMAYSAGNVVGTLVKSAAFIGAANAFYPAGMKGSWKAISSGIIADCTLSSALNETSSQIGMGTDVAKAAGLGALYGISAGVTGAITMKGLPALAKMYVPQAVNAYANSGIVYATANGMENAAYMALDEAIISIAEGRDYNLDSTAAITAFGLGAGFSAFGRNTNRDVTPMQEYKMNVDNAYRRALKDVQAEVIDKAFSEAQSRLIWDNTKDYITHSQEDSIANWIARQYRTQGLPTKVATPARIQMETAGKVHQNISMESLEKIEYGVAMKNNQPIPSRSDIRMTADSSLNKAASQVVLENIDTLLRSGIISDEKQAFSIAKAVVDRAKTKGANIGNFEIRQAFTELTGGLL
jgi:hypothetical protein